MRLSRYLALVFLLCPIFAYGQGMQIKDVATKLVNGVYQPAIGASVTVCTSAGSGTPCTPLATVYTDKALSQTSANPIIIGTSSNSDSLGNFNFYINPSSSVYVVTITGSGLASRSTTYQVACPTDGNCTFSGTTAFTGAVTSCLTNGMYTAGSSCYATINAAVTAAGATGSVLIPSTYAGADVTTNNSNIPIIDLRSGVNGQPAFQTWHDIGSVHPALNLPLGHDVELVTGGPADIRFQQVPAATTTAQVLNIGANASVVVGNTANFAPNYANVSLIVGRETANEEYVPQGSWGVIDATHMSITCAKTHAGTTDLENFGTTYIGTGVSIAMSPTSPSQLAGRKAPVRIFDGSSNYIVWFPGNTADAWPYGAVQWNAVQTGQNGANKNLLFRNNLAASTWQFVNSANTVAMLNLSESSGGPILQFSNPTNTPFIVDASGTDLTRLTFTGTSGGAILYGNVGAGNSGLFRFRNNSTDGVDKVQIDTGATAGVKIFGSTSGNSTIVAPATAGVSNTLPSVTGVFTVTVASGTTTLTANAALAAVTSQAANTTAAAGALTTDAIEWSFATAPTAGDNLCHVLPYLTSGNVNFVRTNPTAAAQNVSALVINWRVIR